MWCPATSTSHSVHYETSVRSETSPNPRSSLKANTSRQQYRSNGHGRNKVANRCCKSPPMGANKTRNLRCPPSRRRLRACRKNHCPLLQLLPASLLLLPVWPAKLSRPQLLIAFDHCANDVIRHADVLQINDLVGGQIEGRGGIVNVAQ